MAINIIILRGPSGSGKSTIAQLICAQRPDVVYIEQDYFSEVVFRHQKNFKEATRDAIGCVVDIARKSQQNVLLEGIMSLAYYEDYLRELARHERVLFVYLDLSLEETIRRHQHRDKAKLFSPEKMMEWYKKSAPLGLQNEVVIKSGTTEEIAVRILKEAGW